ncbi:MAG: hypothetical protein M0P12_07540 [Paludibacteraceae bacterium]|nr:hypothetical protein [Paludibacteraceae bacterium]HOI26113.1 hypothetical protein [Paludibacteraceae bacterium]HOU67397.1 hypothetical protein [Paludibacteraceae bacterium]HPH62263.1 hypothetical protein [Paludibacteraceae bacterium]HQF49543.1 hypothetical protein [Paludibacteraceae bacterium]
MLEEVGSPLDFNRIYTQKVVDMVNIMMEQDGMSFDDAMNKLYRSRVYWALQYKESKFWWCSPARLVTLLDFEIENGRLQPLDLSLF